MEKTIKQILNSMNVNQDREDAESKALLIYKMGPDALDILLTIGLQTEKNVTDSTVRKKFLRAVILTISIFFIKHKSDIQKNDSYANAVSFLIDLSIKDFKSAKILLGNIGYTESDIFQKKLLSLPIVDKHKHDKEISIKEALEEIRLAKFSYGTGSFKQDHYLLGKDKKKRFEMYRIENKRFVLRQSQLKK